MDSVCHRGLKALILVGGYGTRLRPLTLSRPKPVIPFCNKPILIFQIEALVKAGVRYIVLAISYKPEELVATLMPYESKLGVKFEYSYEDVPLGTAGPLALAAKYLKVDEYDVEPFFMLNSDIIAKYRFSELLEFHRGHGREGTIMVVPVSDPSKYGVVLYDEKSGCISRFVEKPQVFIGNHISAGIYVFNKSVLNRISLKKLSIEREVFPAMSKQGQLYAILMNEFWMDVGQSRDYIYGMIEYLKILESEGSELLTTGPNIIPPVIIDPSVKIGENCVIGPHVTIAANCMIGDGVRIKNSTLLEEVKIDNYCWINLSLIGWQSSIGKWARLDNYTVLGMDVDISEQVFINGSKVLPHKSISESILDPSSVIM